MITQTIIPRALRHAKFPLLVLSLLLFCSLNALSQQYVGYLGTYTENGSKGIYTFRFNATTGEIGGLELAATTDNPSFLAIDRKNRFLYAVNEIDSFQNGQSGALSVFAIDRKSGTLQLKQQVASLGGSPAHLSLDTSNRYLLVANYAGGNFAVFPIQNDGQLGPRTAFIQNTGSSVNTDRQQGPHAHAIAVTGDNRFALIADLGIDKLLVYRFDSKHGSLVPLQPGFVALDPGAGPRHFAVSPSQKFVYVTNELTSTVSVFDFDSSLGSLHLKQKISTLTTDFSGANTTAEILIDRKGKFLYVSNRGDDSIAQFSIDPADGKLTMIGLVSTGGKTPRHFEIDPSGQWLLAANQNSNDVRVFRIDSQTGKLTATSNSLTVPTPVCIKFGAER